MKIQQYLPSGITIIYGHIHCTLYLEEPEHWVGELEEGSRDGLRGGVAGYVVKPNQKEAEGACKGILVFLQGLYKHIHFITQFIARSNNTCIHFITQLIACSNNTCIHSPFSCCFPKALYSEKPAGVQWACKTIHS